MAQKRDESSNAAPPDAGRADAIEETAGAERAAEEARFSPAALRYLRMRGRRTG